MIGARLMTMAVRTTTVSLSLVAIACGLVGQPGTPESGESPPVGERPSTLNSAMPSPAATAIRIVFPTPAPDTSSPPPRGPGVQPGTPYPYSLFLHCGVRDAMFDGRNWQAQNVPEEWKYNAPGWTREDATGFMTLVAPDVAVFKSNSGRSIEFRPGPAAACY